jgi:hypothetical protein
MNNIEKLHLNINEMRTEDKNHFFPIYKDDEVHPSFFLKLSSNNIVEFQQYLSNREDFYQADNFIYIEDNLLNETYSNNKKEILKSATQDNHLMKNIVFAVKMLCF